MILNGKNVNHLVISGEEFTSDKAFPNFYYFPKMPEGKQYFSCYYHSYDNAGELSMEPYFSGWEHQFFRLGKKVLVVQKSNINKVKYILVATDLLTNNGDYNGDVGHPGCYWIRMDEVGPMMPIEKTGGVNKPPYLLLIYCLFALLTWEVFISC